MMNKNIKIKTIYYELPFSCEKKPAYQGLVEIGAFSIIGENVVVSNTKIGRCCYIGDNVEIGESISELDGIKEDASTKPAMNGTIIGDNVYIGNNVMIGRNVIVTSGVIIDDNAKIPDNIVVKSGIESNIKISANQVIDNNEFIDFTGKAQLYFFQYWSCSIQKFIMNKISNDELNRIKKVENGRQQAYESMAKIEFEKIESIYKNGMNYIFIRKKSNKLVVVFQPKLNSKHREKGYQFYSFIEEKEVNILYIKDPNSTFNIVKDGKYEPMNTTIELIHDIAQNFGIMQEDIILFGIRSAGFSSIYFGEIYGINYLSMIPLLDWESYFENENTKQELFGDEGYPLSVLEKMFNSDNNFERHGIVVTSHYDIYPESYNAKMLEFLLQRKRTVKWLEHSYLADDIKQKIGSLITPCISAAVDAFINNQLEEYKLRLMENAMPSKIYTNEKVFHKKIDNKNRVIKYLETKKENSKALIVAFNGNASSLDWTADVRANYQFNFLTEFDATVLNIRDSFGITGGWYLLERGDHYPEEMVISLIEAKMAEYNVKRENVILFGASKGGAIALFYAQKYNFKYVFASAPFIHLEHAFVNMPGSVLGIKLENDWTKEEKIQYVNEQLDFYNSQVYKLNENIQGYVWHSAFDEAEGAFIDETFKNNFPNIKFILSEDLPNVDKDEIIHRLITKLSLLDIKEKLKKRIKCINKMNE